MAEASSPPFLFTGRLPDDAVLSVSSPVICCPSPKDRNTSTTRLASGAGICKREEAEEKGGERRRRDLKTSLEVESLCGGKKKKEAKTKQYDDLLRLLNADELCQQCHSAVLSCTHPEHDIVLFWNRQDDPDDLAVVV